MMEILDRFVVDDAPLEPGIIGVLARVNGELEIRTYYADGALRSRSLNGVGTHRWAELAAAAADLIGRANNVLWLADEGHQQDFERQSKGLAVAVLEAFGARRVVAPIEPGPEPERPATPLHWHYLGDAGTRGRPCTSSACATPLSLGLLELVTPIPDGDSPELPGVVDEDGGDRW